MQRRFRISLCRFVEERIETLQEFETIHWLIFFRQDLMQIHQLVAIHVQNRVKIS
jgi:hypothetical protein